MRRLIRRRDHVSASDVSVPASADAPAGSADAPTRPRRRWWWRWTRRGLLALPIIAILALGVGWTLDLTHQPITDRRATLADGRTVQWASHTVARDFASADAADVDVVLVHGTPTDAASWLSLLDAARERGAGVGRRWHLVDRLGFGGSSPGAETSLEAHAAALASVLDACERPVVLVGHSYGGPVALQAAATAGAAGATGDPRIVGIVLLAGATDPGMEDATWFREAVDAIGPILPPTWRAGNRELLHLPGENARLDRMLDEVDCRVAVVHGTWDPVCPHDGTVDHLTRRLDDAVPLQVTSLARHGHNVHRSAPDAVLDAIAWAATD